MQTITKKIGFRNEEGKAYPSRVAAVFLFVAAASFFMPFALFSKYLYSMQYISFVVSTIVTVAGIGLCVKLIGSCRPIIPFCIISGVAIFFTMPTPAMGAVIPALFTASALSAYLWREKFYFPVLMAGVIGVLATFLVTKNVFSALFSLIFLPVAFALVYSFKSGKQRVPTICTLSFALGLPVAALAVAYICVNDGGFSVAVIKNFFDTLREGLIEGLSEAFVEVSKQNAQTSQIISLADATAVITQTVSAVFNLLPAFYIVSLFVATFFIHSLYIALIAPTVKDKKEITTAITFGMSLASAVFFLSALLLSLALEKEHPQYSVAAENIYTIFYPGLTMITFAQLNSLKSGPNASCLAALAYMLLFGLLIFLTDVALMLASIAGAVLIITSKIINKIKENKND